MYTHTSSLTTFPNAKPLYWEGSFDLKETISLPD